jgi:hypothetical protein
LSLLEQSKSQLNRNEKDMETVRRRLSILEGDSGDRRR